jgi:hypothetical protein
MDPFTTVACIAEGDPGDLGEGDWDQALEFWWGKTKYVQ